MTAGLNATVERSESGETGRARPKRRTSPLRRREAWTFRLLLLPWLAGLLLWYAFPMGFSFFVSLTHWDMVNPVEFIGLENYIAAFQAADFWQSLKVTSIYSFVRTPLVLALALFVALLLNQKIPRQGIWRTLYYVPSVLNMVAVSVLWLFLFNRDFGLINGLLFDWFGIIGPDWLGSTDWVLPSFILMSLWSFGQPMVIFLAGLQGIPRELHEAAELDGAGAIRRFKHITLPMLSPVIFFNLIISIIASFQIFASALVMTNGGPDDASLFYVVYLYREGWEFRHMGYASALAWILFAIVMLLALAVIRSASFWVHDESRGR